MTRPVGDVGRLRRLLRLRADWRNAEGSRTSGSPETETSEAGNRRETDALSASDIIRGEAPDDVETRRRSDQLERELRQSRRSRGS
jgi:hypothetical protein